LRPSPDRVLDQRFRRLRYPVRSGLLRGELPRPDEPFHEPLHAFRLATPRVTTRMDHHEVGAHRARRDEFRCEHPRRSFPQFVVRRGEVYQILRVYDHRVETDLAGALDEERGVRAGHGHGPTLGVRDEDLDRLQLLVPGEPECSLETTRRWQVPAYPIGARSRSGRWFGHAADSSGYATVSL
jgi:hypothetical protein